MLCWLHTTAEGQSRPQSLMYSDLLLVSCYSIRAFGIQGHVLLIYIIYLHLVLLSKADAQTNLSQYEGDMVND